MQDDISKIINNSLIVNKENLFNNTGKVISRIKEVISFNEKQILVANLYDTTKGGFTLDFDIVENIFKLIDKETISFGEVIISQKDDEIIYGKEILDKGNVAVISNGNTYVVLEMILRNILAGNTSIIVNPSFMYMTNQLIIKLIQDVLEEFNISKNLVQSYITEEYDEVLSNFANIDLVVAIGDRSLQNLILSKSKNEVVVSGYDHYDIYIDDTTHMDFINKILKSGLDIQVYLKDNIELDYEKIIYVSDADEAIAQINYNGSKYAASIFTSDTALASRFIKEVKASIVTVNTSPSIEKIIDVKENDLVINKTIIYPNSFKIN